MTSDDALLQRFYQHVATQDLLGKEPEVRAAIVEGVRNLSAGRPEGEAAVRVFNPADATDGWTSRYTVVQACTDDMPFLVDSVLAELQQRGLDVHLLIHPQVVVRADGSGAVLEQDAAPDDGERLESWMHLEIDRVPEEEVRAELTERLTGVLRDVRRACQDWQAMRAQVRTVIEDIEEWVPSVVDPDTVEPTLEFLRWLEDNHFTFLGYREYTLETLDGEEVLVSVPGSGLGILQDEGAEEGTVSRLGPEAQATAREGRLLTITKANSRATVHRPVYLDYVGVRKFDADENVVGERRFLGLFTQSAYADSVTRLPVIGGKVRSILESSGFAPDSHSGKDLMGVMENFPRDELFQVDTDLLARTAHEVLHLQERAGTRLFVRKDEFGRFATALVYLPRDRFNTTVRLAIEELLREAYGPESVDYNTKVGESALAQIHYILRMPRGSSIPDVDLDSLQDKVQEATRTWTERLAGAVDEHFGDAETTGEVLARYAGGIPEAYKEDFDAQTGFEDLKFVSTLESGEVRLPLHVYAEADHEPGARRLKVYRNAETSLTDVLPIFSHLGVHVTDERPYSLEARDGTTTYIYDFGMVAASEEVWEPADRDAGEVASAFEEVFAAVWNNRAESDSLNALVLTAGLTWREVVILRTLVRYLRQVGANSLDYLEEALVANPEIAARVVDLFAAKFDPAREGDREQACEEITGDITGLLDQVASLDQDRTIRGVLAVLQGTLRTNYYQVLPDGSPKPHVSLKLSPQQIDLLPEPRPAFEIWVYAPRVEGVHLRFGAVARGGLRWSDRREDFRTEILGLVKAQMVKNAVIVPTGSKGGFFAKQLPDPAQDREAWQAEGVAAYQIFIKGLLDVTDNRVDGAIVPPEQVVRHDGDDSYLVVAADKGTAKFSDIANGVAREYGFWLDDAFASGGSAGYDHKGMGITARGAWESVKRHFRELGLDTQSEEFTAVGIGDMSGDVFGNGMLLSEHIRLVAAFDHRHVFLDPSPDAATSYAERRRLFDLPRSSWEDYDASLISEGGGVYARSAKSVPVSPQVREVLGLEEGVTSATPAELLRAILKAPVDLLWNGGIGTYVKASEESDAQIGDRSNDAIRVNGKDLRVRVVGEGGNLGFSQRGRIEAARAGVQLNTDAIDNSAGVDTSDHEVNIKIALSPLVREGLLDMPARDELLASMTDEVADRVLRHNYEQNVLIGNARFQGGVMAPVHERLMTALADSAGLDRELEFLPDTAALEEREQAGEGLTSPEFSVLVAYSKLALKSALLDSEFPDDPYFNDTLTHYFPQALQDRFGDRLAEHPLRREIIVNDLANAMVNRGGVTFAFRAAEETGATLVQVARAFVVCREVFGLADFVAAVEALDNKVSTATQTELYLEFRRLLDRSVRWFLNNQSLSGGMPAEIERFAGPVATLTPQFSTLLQGVERDRWTAQRDEAVGAGVPEELANRYASLLDSFSLLDIVETAEDTDRPVEEVAAMYFAVSERFRIDVLLTHISHLEREDRWDSLARGAVRDDMYGVLRALARTLVQSTDGAEGQDAPSRIDRWAESNREALDRTSQVLTTVGGLDQPGLAPLSVALRTLRGLVRQGTSN
ncbi:NAD-glutamate dehydrogenase [Ornithinicoccus hortensis]|uniref:Glutamate dehydrogenase (NAD) n=1 Tax=Ornithinicoccus hortensis TaxID=82346 RepID=A0A542YQM7_9MICO|nr:NAD-glutamate dehydrogenase [Ornithinicoccus hortensis]TQL50357.1 glutamate dehydrogenase (NAD) [Ornithinicoccus hortensis]